jgi:hypothetical protein
MAALTNDLALTHRECLARFGNPADGQEPVCNRWPNEVDLELNSKNIASRWCDSQRRISASAIENTRQGASMDVTVLLGELRAWR